jgi:cold shock CspA family protein
MRGEVLHYDGDQGFGFIAGADGNHYSFAREDLRREASIAKGTAVEFQSGGGRARGVSIRAQTASPPAAAPAVPSEAGNAPGARQPHHFGRSAEDSAGGSTSVWSYFWRGLTENYFNFAGRTAAGNIGAIACSGRSR